jgi:hypothetical protein
VTEKEKAAVVMGQAVRDRLLRGVNTPEHPIASIPKKIVVSCHRQKHIPKAGKPRRTPQETPPGYREGWKVVREYRCPYCKVRCSDVIALEVHARFCTENTRGRGGQE